uniref:RNA ligase with polynucleotide kinase domain n=1 Tax=Pithovirus LCPAC404 TaxID=2506597 RepID=A0A481ZDX8_9VIRU|nr:MAG: RNA ligase with polynucleotide kinase domain [Pithovirus LCPAC404]
MEDKTKTEEQDDFDVFLSISESSPTDEIDISNAVLTCDPTVKENIGIDTPQENIEQEIDTQQNDVEQKVNTVQKDIKQEIMKEKPNFIIGKLENILEKKYDNWTIILDTSNTDLCMVSSKVNGYQNIKSKIVDIKHETVVCESPESISEITIKDLLYNDHRGFSVIPLRPLDCSQPIYFSVPDCDVTLHIALEGTIIRLFKHNNIVRYSSYEYLDCTQLKCQGSSKTLVDMYSQLNGPDDDTLFDSTKKYSAYCYIFLISNSETLTSSRMWFGNGILSHIDTIKLFDDKCPFPREDVDWNEYIFDTTSSIKIASNSSKLFHPPNLTLNRALKYLFPSQDTYGSGEKLTLKMVHKITGKQHLTNFLSPNYFWRRDLRGTCQDLNYRFFELLNGVKLHNNQYIESYPNLIGRKQIEHLKKTVKQKGCISKFKHNTFLEPLKFGSRPPASVMKRRELNLLACLLCCSSPYHHDWLLNIFDNYRHGIRKLAVIVQNIIKNKKSSVAPTIVEDNSNNVVVKNTITDIFAVEIVDNIVTNVKAKQQFSQIPLKSMVLKCIHDEDTRNLCYVLENIK